MDRIHKWVESKKKLKKLFWDSRIVKCEICGGTFGLSFHHLHKRVWYYEKAREKLLGDFNQVLLVCAKCHQELEYDRERTKLEFKNHRGK
jgi:hypothetical protein